MGAIFNSKKKIIRELTKIPKSAFVTVPYLSICTRIRKHMIGNYLENLYVFNFQVIYPYIEENGWLMQIIKSVFDRDCRKCLYSF